MIGEGDDNGFAMVNSATDMEPTWPPWPTSADAGVAVTPHSTPLLADSGLPPFAQPGISGDSNGLCLPASGYIHGKCTCIRSIMVGRIFILV